MKITLDIDQVELGCVVDTASDEVYASHTDV
jgi:hypothetical protein